MLRDRLVCGINDPAIQKRLQAEPDLTFNKALALAQGLETAAKDVNELKGSQSSGTVNVKTEPVNSVQQNEPPKGPVTCYRCGVQGHLAMACKHRDKVCRKCNKRGHLARVCKSSKTTPAKPAAPQTGKRSIRRPKRLGYVDTDSEDSGSVSEEGDPIHGVGREKGGERSPPITVHVMLDGKDVSMEVNTGASVSLMSEASFQSLWPGRSLESSGVKLMGYLREPIHVVGCTQVQVNYEGQTAQLSLVVVKGHGPTLLGRNWLHVRLNWKQINYVVNPHLHELLDRFSVVFKEELGTMKGIKAKIEVCEPIK